MSPRWHPDLGHLGNGQDAVLVSLAANEMTIKIVAKTPTTAETIAQVRAFWEAFCAPTTSPWAHFELTCAAYTIETTPAGRQQKIVVRMAQTRLLGGGGVVGCPYPYP
jgi:hypothetical protein